MLGSQAKDGADECPFDLVRSRNTDGVTCWSTQPIAIPSTYTAGIGSEAIRPAPRIASSDCKAQPHPK